MIAYTHRDMKTILIQIKKQKYLKIKAFLLRIHYSQILILSEGVSLAIKCLEWEILDTVLIQYFVQIGFYIKKLTYIYTNKLFSYF